MTQTLHILRKDLKRLRWLLGLWVGVLIVRVAFWGLGTGTNSGFGMVLVVNQLSGVLGTLQMLMLALTAARLVHEEPLVGWDAGWLTRPYLANALMGAKLAFAAAVFVALPLVADLSTMALFHAGLRAQAEAAPTFIASHVTWALLLLALAAVTPSLGAFALSIVGIIAGLSLLLVILVMAATLFDEPSAAPPSRGFTPIPGLIGAIVGSVAMLTMIVYQYGIADGERQRPWQ